MDNEMGTEVMQEGPSEDVEAGSPGEEDRQVTPKSKREFEIDIFKGWCKSCGICAAFCPRECIRLDDEGSPVVVNSSRCTGCGWCELHCPDFAISVRPRKINKEREEAD